MSTTPVDIFQEMTLERDHQELSLGDALDVKAGIILAVIALLGTLSGILLAIPNIGRKLEMAQLVSILCLSIACLFALWTVLPRKYLLAGIPRKYEEWGETLRENYPSDVDRQAVIARGIIQQAARRIDQNQKINKRKSNLLALSFWPTLVALIIDIVTLTALGFLRVLS